MEEEKVEEIKEEKLKKGTKEYKSSSPVMAEAQRINDEKKALIDREEALQERKEKFAAEELAGGRANAGDEIKKPRTQDDDDQEQADTLLAEDTE